MKKFFTMAAIALFTMTSCSDDDAQTPTDTTGNLTEDTVLLRKIISDPGTSYEKTIILTYDNQNRLITTVSSDGSHTDYTYSGNNITQIQDFDTAGNLNNHSTYNYSEGKVSEYIFKTVSGPDTFIERHQYTYHPDGSVSSLDYRTINSWQEMDNGSTAYTFVNDNLVQQVSTSEAGSSSEVIYTYDNKHTPYANIVGFDKLWMGGFSTNNRLSIVHNGNSIIGEQTYSYTYNDLNFPATVTYAYDGEMWNTSQYFYE